jgi:hypothetical protein
MMIIISSLVLAKNTHMGIVAVSIAGPVLFIVAGVLQYRNPNSNRAIAGASMAIVIMAAHISYSGVINEMFGLTDLGWDVLAAAIPAVVLAYICYPVTGVLSLIVLISSVRSVLGTKSLKQRSSQAHIEPQSVHLDSNQVFSENDRILLLESDKGSRNTAIVLVAVFAVLMVACAINFAISAMISARQAAELNEFLVASENKYDMQARELFDKTSFPERGFELENHFDVSEDTVSGGYEFFYRSKKTGLSWRIYEDTDGKMIALLSEVIDDDSPLDGNIDDFVLVEEDGDYHMAFMHAGHGGESLGKEEIAAIVDVIDKKTLDSYDEQRILRIAQGRESYRHLPESVHSQ